MSEKSIDLELGAKVIRKDRQDAEEIVTMLAKRLPEDKNNIVQAHEKKDLEHLRELVHRLHGATCYCGTPRLRTAAGLLEKTLKLNKTSELTSHYQNLLIEIDAVLIDFKNKNY